MADVLSCTSMEIVRGIAGWDWYAYSDGKPCIDGPLQHTGKRPRLASMVRAVPRIIHTQDGGHWHMPEAAQDPKAWNKLRGQNAYCWKVKK